MRASRLHSSFYNPAIAGLNAPVGDGAVELFIDVHPLTFQDARRPVNDMYRALDLPELPLAPVPPPSPHLMACVARWATPGVGQLDNDDDVNAHRSYDVLGVVEEILGLPPFQHASERLLAISHAVMQVPPPPQLQRPPLEAADGWPAACEPDVSIAFRRRQLLNNLSTAAVQERRRPPAGSADVVWGFVDALHRAGSTIRLTYRPDHPANPYGMQLIGPAVPGLAPLPAAVSRWLARRMADQIGYLTVSGTSETSMQVGNGTMVLALTPDGAAFSRSIGLHDNGMPFAGNGNDRPNHAALLLAHALSRATQQPRLQPV